jgi:hypothetical protein
MKTPSEGCSRRREGVLPKRSAGFQTCCIADIHVGTPWNLSAFPLRRFGNLRYGRLGSLRYTVGQHARESALICPEKTWAPADTGGYLGGAGLA